MQDASLFSIVSRACNTTEAAPFSHRGINNSTEVRGQGVCGGGEGGNVVLTFHCGIIHSVWSSRSQINHVTVAIKETMGV